MGLLSGSGCQYVRIGPAWPEKKIFFRPADYQYFLRLLKKYKNESGARVYAFCFLADAIHLIIQAETMVVLDNLIADIRKSYWNYFAARYDRDTRPRWRPARIIPIKGHDSLAELIKTLEFQPVRSALTFSPVNYPWSSCSYRVLGENSGILDRLHSGDIVGDTVGLCPRKSGNSEVSEATGR